MALVSAMCGPGIGALLDRVDRFRATTVSFAPLVTATAGIAPPLLMGKTFDRTGSYDALLPWLAVTTFAAAALMLTLPVHTWRTRRQPVSAAAR